MKNVLRGAVASTVAACALVVLLGGASHAQTLAGYSFDAVGGGSTFNATTTGANVTAGAINNTGASNTNIVANNTFGYGTGYVLQAVVNAAGPAASISAATAVLTNSFFQFTITPSSGYALSITGLSFQAGRGGAGTPRGYVVRSSVDNFLSDLGTSDVTTVRPTFSNYNVGLSLTGLTTATTFRIYTYAPGTIQSVEYDNVTLSGTSSIIGAAAPEPSSFGLAASILPLAGVVFARRKRRA